MRRHMKHPVTGSLNFKCTFRRRRAEQARNASLCPAPERGDGIHLTYCRRKPIEADRLKVGAPGPAAAIEPFNRWC